MLTEEPAFFTSRSEPSSLAWDEVLPAVLSQRDLVRDELEHRFRNVLAVVDAIMRQTLRGARADPALADTLSLRIAALASSNDLIRRKPLEAASIADVVTTALAPFSGESGRITGGGPDIRLDPGLTVALTMVLHELATNALKHGALSKEGGRVFVQWGFKNRTDDDFSFEWLERDGPEVHGPSRDGFGLRMIRMALAPYVLRPPQLQHRPDGVMFEFSAEAVEGQTALPQVTTALAIGAASKKANPDGHHLGVWPRSEGSARKTDQRSGAARDRSTLVGGK